MPRRPIEIYQSSLTLQDCKICTRCEQEKDLINFYELRGRHKGGIGYMAWCKQCFSEYRKSRQDKRVTINPRSGLHEICCPNCKETKPTFEFYSENYAFSKYCKRCIRTARIAAE
jgi:hypothetical protein